MRYSYVPVAQSGFSDLNYWLYGLPVQIGKPKHLYNARGIQQIREPRDVMEHWQRFDRAAVAGAKSVFRPCAFPTRPCRHHLQDSVDDRIPRSTREGMGIEISRRKE